MVSTGTVIEYLTVLEHAVAGVHVPVVDLIAVQTSDPYRILIATILSARTKDEVTAVASARLFECAPDVYRLDELGVDEIERLIYPVGFYKTKAGHLRQTARLLIDSWAGHVPDRLEDLIELPGVGRKTANLVLAVAFGKPAVCVDTHVHRIMNIWGYVMTKTPYETEMAIRKKLPKAWWSKVNRLLVAYGQEICRPVSPKCDQCALHESCPQIGIKTRGGRRKLS